jgi:hypothetical protein
MPEPDLTELERRLSGWRPANDGLDADAMLFAAGRASVRRSPGRFAWPAVAAGLIFTVGVLGSRLANERETNRDLLARLQPTDMPVVVDARPLELPQSSYFFARRAVERDPDSWISEHPTGESALTPEAGLHAGQRDWDLDR